jgi:predicted nucleic acid-binding protein
MKKLFIDSSVLYSAAYSSSGRSRELIFMSVRGDLTLVISELVVEEVRRNLVENAPQALDLFDFLLDLVPIEIVNPSREEILAAAELVTLKDAPIIAAAKKSQADLLVTLDKKHLLGKPELAQFAGMEIVTPNEAVKLVKTST